MGKPDTFPGPGLVYSLATIPSVVISENQYTEDLYFFLTSDFQISSLNSSNMAKKSENTQGEMRKGTTFSEILLSGRGLGKVHRKQK